MNKSIRIFFRICIFACLGISLLMRGLLFHISYEYDELFTAITTDPTLPFSWIYKHYLLVDVHPPLYNALMWLYNHVVPYGPEIWLRLPSFLMGVGAIVCAWFCFPKCFGKEARLLFTALISCNAYAIVYSQYARSYMLLLLLAICYTFLFLEIFRLLTKSRRIRKRKWISLTILAILLAWNHYFGTLLVGLCTAILLFKSLKTKTSTKPVIIMTVLLAVSFLPWLIPNFVEQLSFKRFEGNWWGNETKWATIPETFITLFFTNKIGLLLTGILALMAGWSWGKYCKRIRKLPYGKDLLLLLLVCGLALFVVALISLRVYLFYGRYFIAFLPAGYLILAILWAPVMRKNFFAQILFVGVLLTNLFVFMQGYKIVKNTPQMPMRIVSQIYRDFYAGQEMFVVAEEGFPPVAMPAMYGFYVNRVYNLDVPVTELVSLDPQARNEVLKRKNNAFIWMPNCTVHKLEQLAGKWKRSFGVYERIGGACLLRISN